MDRRSGATAGRRQDQLLAPPVNGVAPRVINPFRVSALRASLTVGSVTLSSRARAVLRAAGGDPKYTQSSTRNCVLDRSFASAARQGSTCGPSPLPVASQRTTSLSLPVATSKTKPRSDSCLVTNGLSSMRRSDWRTSSSTSVKDSAAHSGLMPVSS